MVAPFTGAWIEIRYWAVISGVESGVAPFTGAWIEIVDGIGSPGQWSVAPFTGAWIEIMVSFCVSLVTMVAPFTGAWIEIHKQRPKCRMTVSLPSRERGLK